MHQLHSMDTVHTVQYSSFNDVIYIYCPTGKDSLNLKVVEVSHFKATKMLIEKGIPSLPWMSLKVKRRWWLLAITIYGQIEIFIMLSHAHLNGVRVLILHNYTLKWLAYM